MYNGFYRSISASAAPTVPPPPSLNPERQSTVSQSFATSNYIQRSTVPTSQQSVSPPPIPPLPSSIVTDRLNWRHDEGSQLVGDVVNPSEFYQRLPGALVSEQSYGQMQPAGGLNMRQSTSDTGFYPFAVSSTLGAGLTHVQPAIQAHAAPTQYAGNGMLSRPAPSADLRSNLTHICCYRVFFDASSTAQTFLGPFSDRTINFTTYSYSCSSDTSKNPPVAFPFLA